MITAIIVSGLDKPVGHAGELRRDGCIGFSLQIRVQRIGLNIVLILPPEAVLPHADGRYAGDPKVIPEPGVAVFRQLAQPSKSAGLLRREVQAAVLQKLLVVAEPPQVSGLGQDDQSDHRADAGDGPKPKVVGVILEIEPGASDRDPGVLEGQAGTSRGEEIPEVMGARTCLTFSE